MKLVQEKPAFQPFSIMIENADEAHMLACLLGIAKSGDCTALGLHKDTAYNMYVPLEQYYLPAADGLSIEHE